MNEICAFLGVYIFVTIVVAGWRALNAEDARQAERADLARRKAANQYRGPIWNRHGREIR